MPIKGLSQRRELPLGGYLKLGDEKGENRPGRPLDYFRFDPEDAALLSPFRDLYGPKPQRLVVAFHSDDREEVFSHYYRRWQGGHVWCFGDNEQGWRLPAQDHNDQAREEVACTAACPFRELPGQKSRERSCRPEGWLKVLLPELAMDRLFAVTARQTSIKYINTMLEMLLEWRGHLRGLPLIMHLQPFRIRGMTNYAVCLSPNASLIEMVTGRKLDSTLLDHPDLDLSDLEVPMSRRTAAGEGDEDPGEGEAPEGEAPGGEAPESEAPGARASQARASQAEASQATTSEATTSEAPTSEVPTSEAPRLETPTLQTPKGLSRSEVREIEGALAGATFSEAERAVWRRAWERAVTPEDETRFLQKLRVETALRRCRHLTDEQRTRIRSGLKARPSADLGELLTNVQQVGSPDQGCALAAQLAPAG